MSIKAKQFIAVHLKEVKTIVTQFSGRFFMRFFLFEAAQQPSKQPNFAVPINIVSQDQVVHSQHSQTNENTYQTRSFVLKHGSSSAALNEVCIFKHEFNLFSEQQEKQHHLEFCCQLISVEYNSNRVVGTFHGRFYSTSVSQFLCMDFYSPCACQVTGSVHSCLYNYQFEGDTVFNSLEAYCGKLVSEEVEKLLRYLLTESKYNENRLKQLIDQDVNYDLEKTQVQKLKMLVLEKRKTQQLITDAGDDLPLARNESADYSYGHHNISGRQRKKIFQKRLSSHRLPQDHPKEHAILKKESSIEDLPKEVTVQQFQRIIHSNALKVYESWNKLIKILVNQEKCVLLRRLQDSYMSKVQKKIGEGIIKFKGSFDFDTYASETDHRNKMAYQLRNQPVEYLKELNEFNFAPNQLWSETKPIFFEEETDSQPTLIKQIPKKLMIFLVHGLGACRVDMEKLKNQLRRFYGERVNIIISTSNQGKTEGDIAAMSIRLASEVEHHLAKEGETQKLAVSFIGHSMGGVIIRGALPNLKQYKHLFYSFVTLSSPHIGYAYSTSKLVDAGLWVMSNWKQCQSLIQLTMEDSEELENSFIYTLSRSVGLEWFSKVTFISSRQDLYVPYYSARVQKSNECIVDAKKMIKKGVINTEIIDNILNSIKGRITRIDVNFYIKQQNVDNLIGRAAHISFINNVEMLKTICHCGDRIIF